MNHDPKDQRLSRIATLWSVVCQARDGPSEAAAAAQEQLLERYGKAVRRYLLGALRDPDAADELAQEFALRVLRGDCRGADPRRGRFRDFVKGVLFHLIADFHRGRRRGPRPLPSDGPEPVAPAAGAADPDHEFLESWRRELLDRAWKGLQDFERRTGRPLYVVLRCRAEHLHCRSAQLAELLTTQLDKPVSADWARQMLHRARAKFAELLLNEVAQTLEQPTLEQLEEELLDLGLFDYCQPALDRLRRTS